ncbi:MAG: site-specific DNA-methyltransferase [Armatimonadetes bacterium]|nr:site-specific DNA-methyltransferase [Armatimonadota bacterium]
MRGVELLWPGKYAPDGRRRQPDPAALARPLHIVAAAGDPVGGRLGRLVLGDNLAVLSTWLGELRGEVDLVYIDPPFDIGTTHTIRRTSGAGEAVAQTAFHDAWDDGEGGYLAFMAPRLELLRDLLADQGSLLLHCGHRWEPALALVCDELFGRGDRGRRPHAAGFRNAVRWTYGLGGSSARCYPKKHDTILWYTRSARWHFEPPRTPARSQRMRGESKKQPDVWDLPAINN